MTTSIRAEISSKKPYWIDRHRYYELKHFCLQYPVWRTAYEHCDGYSRGNTNIVTLCKSYGITDPTGKCVATRLYFRERMEMIEQSALAVDPELADYLIKSVTLGLSFNYLKNRLDMPCSKDTYYDRYRKFFWTLSKTRG